MPNEVAVRRPGNQFMLDPTKMTLADWEVACDYLAQSDIVPESLRGKPANIFLVIHMGMELGVSWPRALQTIYSPGRGQTGIVSALLVRNIRDAGHKIRWEEREDGCICRIWRKDEPDEPPYEAEFTREDAATAKLLTKENYIRYPKQMWRHRATSQCADKACPEVKLGFHVIEAMDGPDAVQLQPAQPPAPGVAAAPAPDTTRDGGSPAQELDDIERTYSLPGPVEIIEGPVPGTPEHMEAWADSPDTAATAVYPSAEPADGGVSEDGGVSAPADDDSLLPATRERLGRAFRRIGVGAREYPGDVRRAMSAWVQSPITNIRELKDEPARRLAEKLEDLPEDQGMVLLFDSVEAWERNWETADPAGWEAYMEERA